MLGTVRYQASVPCIKQPIDILTIYLFDCVHLKDPIFGGAPCVLEPVRGGHAGR